MICSPKFSFFLSALDPVKKGDVTWRKPLPMSRRFFLSPSMQMQSPVFTYGDYFETAVSFLGKDDFSLLTTGASRQTGRRIKPKDLHKINIYLEKHGEFYHPSRVEAVLSDGPVSMVLNVAVSKTGKDFLPREYRVLRMLDRRTSCGYLPKVYGMSEQRQAAMFLGQWFDAFHEFHPGLDKTDGIKKIRVWDPADGASFLTADQAFRLYREAAYALTCYFDAATCEQILAWSHAAGDFVVNQTHHSMRLKLITARGYGPLLNLEHRDAGSILEALVVFLLDLSLRMRLDRIDGVYDMVWAEDASVEATLDGFFQGLAEKPQHDLFGDPLDVCFKGYLALWTPEELLDLCRAVASAGCLKGLDDPMGGGTLEHHIELLFDAIHRISPGGHKIKKSQHVSAQYKGNGSDGRI